MDTPSPARTVIGHVDVHPRGYGFLVVPASGSTEALSAFIPPAELRPYLAGDVVSAQVTASADGRWSASGLKLLERSRREVYGEVVPRSETVHLRLDREVGTGDWPLEAEGVALQPGDAVVARLEGDKAHLLRRLEPGADRSLERILVRHGLRRGFDEAARAELQPVLALPHALGARRDLRSIPTFTVDSPSTRVIDDALSVLPADSTGALRLFVSIADAAEFVPEGSALDLAARERSASAYLAGSMLPMLPEELSAHWLSLVPGEERLCLTVELRIDPAGRITAVDLHESLIRSWTRLSYTEVADYLERGEVSGPMEPVREALPWLRAAAARLTVAREGRGLLDMNRDETAFTFDEVTGEVTGLELLRTTPAHTVVERCMGAANEAVAEWLVARGLPSLFRVQEEPSPTQVEELATFARHSGLATGFGPRLTPRALAAFERQLSGAPDERALRAVLRRSLGPSRYTAVPGPHFGLAVEAYVHFTSPIRRYADLTVHRTLKHYLRGHRDFMPQAPAQERLAIHLNARSRVIQRAEKDRQRSLEARVMAAHVGRELPGRITRVRGAGLLVQLEGIPVEGFLPTEALPEGPYTADPRETSLTGAARTFTLGMPLRVRVASTNEQLGRIELALASGANAVT